ALWAPALVLAAPAWAELLSDTPLVLAWALTSLALSLLAVRVREPLLLVAAAGYLGAGLAHTLVVDAPLRHLFVASPYPASGIGSVAAVVLAALFLADACGRAPDGERWAAFLCRCRLPLVWGAVILASYGISLVILELFERVGGAAVGADFQSGHTAVSAF